VPGTVIRTGTVKMLESERMYQCSKCKHQFSVRADVEQFYAIPKPARCPSEMDPPCPSTNFTALNVDISRRAGRTAPGERVVVGCSRLTAGASSGSDRAADQPENCRDIQEIKIQEQVNKLAVGNISGCADAGSGSRVIFITPVGSLTPATHPAFDPRRARE